MLRINISNTWSQTSEEEEEEEDVHESWASRCSRMMDAALLTLLKVMEEIRAEKTCLAIGTGFSQVIPSVAAVAVAAVAVAAAAEMADATDDEIEVKYDADAVVSPGNKLDDVDENR